MRIQLAFLLAFLSFDTKAVSDKTMQELFQKYGAIMDQKKVELIDEVFTEKFIKASGGKKELVEKVQELTPPPSRLPVKLSWKKGLKGKIYFADLKEVTQKSSKKEASETQFIVIEENGKLKIDGTLSDGN